MASIRDFASAKNEGRKLVMVTCYDAWSAKLLADAPVDCLLVGDSALMVVHGERDTLGAFQGRQGFAERQLGRQARSPVGERRAVV